MANERIIDLNSGSINSSELLIVGDPSTGTLSRISGQQIKDYAGGVTPNVSQSLSDGSTITWNYLSGNIAAVTIAANRTLSLTGSSDLTAGLLFVSHGVNSSSIILPGVTQSSMVWSLNSGSTDIVSFFQMNGGQYWDMVNFGATPSGGGGGGFDGNAQNYLNAVINSGSASLDATHQGYINTFVTSLKSNSVYNKIQACHLLFMGNATASAFNLVNPNNTNAAFRMYFSGSWAFSVSGAKSDGTTTIGDTFFNSSTNASQNALGFGYYIADSGSSGAPYWMGNYNGTVLNSLKNSGTIIVSSVNSDSADSETGTIGNRFMYVNRSATPAFSIYRDGTSLGSPSIASDTPPNSTILIGGVNLAFASSQRGLLDIITDGSLSSTDVTHLTNAINTLVTNFGINV